MGESRLRDVRVVATHEGAGFSGGTRPEMTTLQDDHVSHAALRELKSGRQAVDTAADYHDRGGAW